MTKEQFLNELEKIDINLTQEQITQLEKYYQLLIETNKNINLTAITKKEDVYLKHFYDSLTLIKAINLNDKLNIIDIGTGAGFPGLVLKIVFPTLSVTLLDSLEKRIKFLNLVIETLNLKDINTIHSRIEDYNNYENFDIVVSRAVSNTSILLELGCQLPKINGYFILMKGKVEEELRNSSNAIKKLNYQIDKVINFKLPIELSERNIVVLKKIDKTNKNYPREYKKIKAKSL